MMCPKCLGTGEMTYVGKKLHTCLRCNGTGRVKAIRQSCDVCGGWVEEVGDSLCGNCE